MRKIGGALIIPNFQVLFITLSLSVLMMMNDDDDVYIISLPPAEVRISVYFIIFILSQSQSPYPQSSFVL